MAESNANQPVTERLCQERQKHVQAVQDELKDINGKLDTVQSTLTELSTEMKNHFDGHSKGWNRGYAVVMCVIALSAIIISIVTLSLSRAKNLDQSNPSKTGQLQRIPKEPEIVHYQP